MAEEEQWLSRPTQEASLNTGLLAEVLREYRQANGLNQAAMAKLLNLDQSYVSKIETGQRQVRDLETLLRIANRLNIPPSHVESHRNCFNPSLPQQPTHSWTPLTPWRPAKVTGGATGAS